MEIKQSMHCKRNILEWTNFTVVAPMLLGVAKIHVSYTNILYKLGMFLNLTKDWKYAGMNR